MHKHNFCLYGYHKYNTLNLRVYGVTQYVPSNWVSPAAAPILLSGGLGMLGCLPHLFLHDVAPGWYAAPEWDSQAPIYYWEYSTPFTDLNCPKMWRTNYADSTLRQCHYFCNMRTVKVSVSWKVIPCSLLHPSSGLMYTYMHLTWWWQEQVLLKH